MHTWWRLSETENGLSFVPTPKITKPPILQAVKDLSRRLKSSTISD
jgi:hypothetical protein